jgi:4-amino-4-deoxy-L-arabinose transferase-like glycosyltransferase
VATVLLAAVAAYVLFGIQAPRVSGVTRVKPERPVAAVAPGADVCQLVTVPAGTGAVQTLTPGPAAPAGLSLRLRTQSGGALAGSRSVAARNGGLRFALDRTVRRDTPAQLCIRSTAAAPVALLGDLANTGLTRGGQDVRGALALIFYRPGQESVATLAGLVATRIGRVRGAFGGGWRAPVIVALLLVALAATVWSVLAALRAPRRRALWVALFAVAACHALAWSLLTPVFQIPDEPAHLSYVQDLVEKGQPPRPIGPSFSPQLATLVEVSALGSVNFNPDGRPPWSASDDALINQRVAANPDRVNKASYLAVADYPPAYYAAMAPVYRAVTAAGGNTLDAITPLRAASALLAGVAIVAVFAFLLELFPERRVAALLAALICAWHPVFAWISGGVSPDALLIPTGCVMFWLFARAFIRGPTVWLAAGLGLVLALAVLTKVAALGLIPGWCVGVAVLVWRSRERLRIAAAAGLCALLPLVTYALLNVTQWDRPAVPLALTGSAAEGGPPAPAAVGTSVGGFATYLWEYVLPRLGGMRDYFHSAWTPKDLWVPIWVGRFGWSDYQFPTPVNRAALVVYLVIAAAALVVLVRWLRGRPELRVPAAVLAALSLGLVVLIARVGYPLRASGSFVFEQGRYYMPLLPLYALALVLASQLLRPRWARAALLAFLVVAVLHAGAALGLTAKRYYTFSGYQATGAQVADAR